MKTIGFFHLIKRLIITIVLVSIIYFSLLQKIGTLTKISSKKIEISRENLIEDCSDCICGMENLIGRTHVFSIETPMNDSMRELTPSFDNLREKFNRTTRDRF